MRPLLSPLLPLLLVLGCGPAKTETADTDVEVDADTDADTDADADADADTDTDTDTDADTDTGLQDLDGDGYDTSTDCDDADPSIHPGAVDTEGDGIDQDCDGVDGVALRAVEDLVAGDLVVSEIMAYPAESEEGGQWFEVHNPGDVAVDLDGLELVTASGSATVAGALVATAGDYVVFASSEDEWATGGAPVDYAYGWSLRLDAEGGSLTLKVGTLVIDRVPRDRSFPGDDWGRSTTLDPTLLDATSNDDGDSWCYGSTPYGWASNLGTPGGPNDACPADSDGDGYDTTSDCDDTDPEVYPGATETWYDGIDQDCAGDDDYDQDGDGWSSDAFGGEDCDDTERRVRPDTVDIPGDGVDQDCDGADATGETILDIDDLGVGDLVIDEVLLYPDYGSWDCRSIEVYNPLEDPVLLDGLELTSDWSSYTVWDALVVEAGDYVVFCGNADLRSNGGVPVDHETAGFEFGETEEGSVLSLVGTLGVIDMVPFDRSFALPSGAALALDPGLLDAVSNDDGRNWCEATTVYGWGDRGTPGEENVCPADDDGDGYSELLDCDDGDATVYPGADEIWYDGVDQDCAGDDDYDQDADGARSDAWGGDDCDDTSARVHPGGVDIPGDGIDQDCDGADDVGDPILTVDDLGAGDLVLSELLVYPEAGSWSCQWIEIYNPTGVRVLLDGLEIATRYATETLSGDLLMDVDGYVVLCGDADPESNGGVPVDYETAGLVYEGDEELALSLNGPAGVVDRVVFGGGDRLPWGASLALSADTMDAVSNDDLSNWCEATTSYGWGDRGTPGEANDGC